ncbi:MAG TPA: DUF2273 domain-containing protein, partial [Firmicutes bacterium]|nr:DUF2273 domain-containing protein [Bacillota bacterium]
MNWWILLSRHWGKILGALLGLIFALLVINYGFWISLFIFLCIAVGLLIGWRLDLKEDVGRFFRRLFSAREE